MKIKKMPLVIALLSLSVLFVTPNLFAAGVKEVKSTETLAMIQSVDVENNVYKFDVLTDKDEITVTINKNTVDTVYNIDLYDIGDYVSFNNLDVTQSIIKSDNIRYVTPFITSGAIFFMPVEPAFEIPEDDYGFDNVLEHGFNYTYGYYLMESFNSQNLFINAHYFARGVLDILSIDEDDFYTIAELQSFVEEYQSRFTNPEIPQKTENGPVSSLEDVINLGKPSILDDQFAYAYGYLIAAQFLTTGIPVDTYYFPQGLLDAAYGRESQLTQYQMDSSMRDFEKQFAQKQEEFLNQIKENNLNQAQSFLDANIKQPGVVALDSGVQYKKLTTVESGDTPTLENEVTIHYELTLLDGKVIDSSYQRGNPATFKLTQVIAGFAEAVMQMKPGEALVAWLPPHLGYGEEGNQNIEPNSLLTFRIELISINN